MKYSLPLRAVTSAIIISVVATALIGCSKSQPDLPVTQPTKISKLHNFGQMKGLAGKTGVPGGAPGGTSAPSGSSASTP